MRIPKYLSPTSIALWQYDIEEFYQKYLSDNKRAREPQTQPMSIGSAFDAFIKSYLYERLVGDGNNKYQREAIFEQQVEPHNRDWALVEGAFVFEEYKKAGCLADLMLELKRAIDVPRFEFVIEDTVTTNIGEIPLLGIPDIFFLNDAGAKVILDWKVNGYCRQGNTSPMKGYVKLRPGNKIHRDCHLMMINGVLINVAMHLEDGNKSWADQLSIYSWLLGEDFGSEQMIVGIDQIVGNRSKLRFATHRLRISPDYQFELLALIEQIWETVNSGWIFRSMTEEESVARCKLLDQQTGGKNSELQRICE